MKSPAVGTLAREKTRRPTHPMRTTTAGSCGAQLYRTSSATTGRDGEGTRQNRGERRSKRAEGEERGSQRTHTQRKRVTHKRGNQKQQKAGKKRKRRGRGDGGISCLEKRHTSLRFCVSTRRKGDLQSHALTTKRGRDAAAAAAAAQYEANHKSTAEAIKVQAPAMAV